MPEFYRSQFPGESTLVIWQMDAYEQYTLPSNTTEQELVTWHPKRSFEYHFSRWLLYKEMQILESTDLFKDEFGKLHFKNEDLFLSISHSGPYTSFITSQLPVGIDIQTYDQRMLRIAKKFMYEDEIIQLNHNLKDLNMCWCIKEAVYKAYGKRNVLFKEDIDINLLQLRDNNSESLQVTLTKDNSIYSYDIYISHFENLCMAIALFKHSHHLQSSLQIHE